MSNIFFSCAICLVPRKQQFNATMRGKQAFFFYKWPAINTMFMKTIQNNVCFSRSLNTTILKTKPVTLQIVLKSDNTQKNPFLVSMETSPLTGKRHQSLSCSIVIPRLCVACQCDDCLNNKEAARMLSFSVFHFYYGKLFVHSRKHPFIYKSLFKFKANYPTQLLKTMWVLKKHFADLHTGKNFSLCTKLDLTPTHFTNLKSNMSD